MGGCFDSNGTRSRRVPTLANTVSLFELARTVFNDPRLLTMTDLERSETTSGVLSRLLHKRLDSFGGLPLVRCRSGSSEDPADIGAPCNANRDSVIFRRAYEQ